MKASGAKRRNKGKLCNSIHMEKSSIHILQKEKSESDSYSNLLNGKARRRSKAARNLSFVTICDYPFII